MQTKDKRPFPWHLALLSLLFLFGTLPLALAAPGDISRISVGSVSSGTEGNGQSANPSVSSNGRFIAFESQATNLVPADTNNASDIFLYDRQTGATSRVSIDSSGNQSNGESLNPSVSANGRFITFSSTATNLVTGDTNGEADIFIHDRQTGTTSRVSVTSSGNQSNGESLNPSVSTSSSNDGRFVTFSSTATNLVTGDTNGEADIFVHDRQTGATSRVSVTSSGSQGNGESLNPTVSANGRFVTFSSTATNLVTGDTNGEADIFIHDRNTETTTRVSVTSSGTQSNGESHTPTVSANGRFITFTSTATNLVTGDTNNANDIFVHDYINGTTSRASIDSSGIQGNGNSFSPSISGNGRFITFHSLSTNLVAGDLNGVLDVFVHDRTSSTTTRLSITSSGTEGNNHSGFTSVSDDGRFVAFHSSATNLVPSDTNNTPDIFFHDRDTQTTSRISLSSSGNEGNNSSSSPSVSANGRFVAFESHATNLVVGDTNNAPDIFIRDNDTQIITRISVDSSGNQGNDGSISPSISTSVSDDGRFVAFTSYATNLVAGDTNNAADVFVHDRNTGTTTRVSIDSSGNQSNGESLNPSISGNGRFVTFESQATNLVTGDTNNVTDIFIHDRQTTTTTRVSVDSSGNEGDNSSSSPSVSTSVSDDGRFVAFQSNATNLVAGDTNNATDVFVHDRDNGTTTRVSVDSSGAEGDNSSSSPSISANGRFVAFTSSATNLVAGDTNNATDVFVHDRDTPTTTRVSLDSSGAEGDNSSSSPSVSADGRFITFSSSATNLVTGDTNNATDVFVRDRTATSTTRVSVDSSGTQGNDDSSSPSISSSVSNDGRFVAFQSNATNLVTSDTNNATDIFVHDRTATATTRLSINSSGNQGNEASSNPSISANGRFIAFESTATNLITGDTNNAADVFVYDRDTQTTTRISIHSSGTQANDDSSNPSVSTSGSDDGRFIAFESNATNLVAGDTNNATDIFIHDRTTQTTSRVSIDSSGNQGNEASSNPSVSANGRFIIFESEATNLVPGDTNNASDIFIHDRTTQTTSRLSIDSSGNEGNDESHAPAVSSSGRFVTFTSAATNLVAGDTNNATDIFIHDRDTQITTRISVNSSGTQANGESLWPSISTSGSNDGRFIAFVSTATNLVTGDTNSVADVFIHDRNTQTTTRVSVDSSGVQSNNHSGFTSVSANGRFVVFGSVATNLVIGDTNLSDDVFVHDRDTQTTTRLSVNSSGTEGNDLSGDPSISADGRFITFISHATNLVPNDTNSVRDVFLVEQAVTTTAIEIIKQLEPASDTGTFDLKLNGNTILAAAGHRAITGEIPIAPGTHTVSETAVSPANLANYNTNIQCRADDGNGLVVAAGSATTSLQVPVAAGDDIVCVITNTYQQGSIEIVKQLEPANDTGTFDLKLDGNTVRAGAGDGETSGEIEVLIGTHTVSETAVSPATLAHYNTTIECRASNGNGSVVASGSGASLANVPVNDGDDIVCTITNSHKTGAIEIVKQLEPASDSGTFDLKLDGNTVRAGAGDGETSGEIEVLIGTHTVSETAVSPATLAHYNTTIECRASNGNGTIVASGNGASLANVPVNDGDDIVCTITNSHKTGAIEIVKQLEPASDSGTFDLKLNGNTVEAAAGDGDTTGEIEVLIGTHTVSETAVSPATLAHYNTTIECRASNGNGSVVASGSGASLANVPVNEGDDLVCTITNTRKIGAIEIVKDLYPTNDSGTFDLKLDGTTVRTAAGDGGTSGERQVAVGTHTVSETAVSPTNLADYATRIECRTGSGTVVASGNGTSLANVPVNEGDDIVCTITNTRDSGTLEIVKQLEPASDSGTFDLKLDGNTKLAAAGDGGTTGPIQVPIGTHTVSETAVSPATLANYNTHIECRANGGNGSVVASGSGASLANVPVNEDDDIVCTITNSRKLGTLEIVKQLEPANDSGTFNLKLNGNTVRSGAGDGATTGEIEVPIGAYTVSETAVSPATLADYNTHIECRTNNGNGSVVASGNGASLSNVPVNEDDDIVCTITNTHKKGAIEIVKQLEPANDSGTFDLKLNGNTVRAAAGDGGSSGEMQLFVGNYTVSETAVSPAKLADYATRIECRASNGNGSVVASGNGASLPNVPVREGDDIVCTITNTRQIGAIEIVKQLEPASDSGTFDLKLNGSTVRSGAGDGATTGELDVLVGSYTVSETAVSPANLANYNTRIECRASNGNGSVVASGNGASLANVPVGRDDDIVCTITNTRKIGAIEIVKQLEPASDSGTFDLKLDGTTVRSGVGDGATTGELDVAAGTHTVSETAVSPANLANYTTRIECRANSGNGSVVASGNGASLANVPVNEDDDIVCTITNTRKIGAIEIVKQLEPANDSGTFDLKLNGNTVRAAAGDGQRSGEIQVLAGTHTVSETAVAPANLADYATRIECRANNGNGSVVASGNSASLANVPVGGGDDIVCTITNTRDKGRIEIVKDLHPANDNGTFDLKLDGSTELAAAGDGDRTGEIRVSTGSHRVSETAVAPADLANYTTSIECRANNGNGSVVASGNGSSLSNVPVNENDDIVCTITNTRKTGAIEIIKELFPAGDSGTFNLKLDGTTRLAAAGDGGTTGELQVSAGSHRVSETAVSPANLSDYTTSIECRANNGTGSVVASGTGSSLEDVPVGGGDDIVCTITNTRKTGVIEIVKQLEPSNDSGTFNLRLNGNTALAAAGDGATTGKIPVVVGAYTVSETAVAPADLANYHTRIKCRDNNGNGSVVASGDGTSLANIPVTEGDNIVCTITNTHKTGALEIVKQLEPSNDSGTFDLKVNGNTVRAGARDGESSGQLEVFVGNHTVSETAVAPANLANYITHIECRGDNGSGSVVASGNGASLANVPVAEGNDIVCIITNERKPTYQRFLPLMVRKMSRSFGPAMDDSAGRPTQDDPTGSAATTISTPSINQPSSALSSRRLRLSKLR